MSDVSLTAIIPGTAALAIVVQAKHVNRLDYYSMFYRDEEGKVAFAKGKFLHQEFNCNQLSPHRSFLQASEQAGIHDKKPPTSGSQALPPPCNLQQQQQDLASFQIWQQSIQQQQMPLQATAKLPFWHSQYSGTQEQQQLAPKQKPEAHVVLRGKENSYPTTAVSGTAAAAEGTERNFSVASSGKTLTAYGSQSTPADALSSLPPTSNTPPFLAMGPDSEELEEGELVGELEEGEITGEELSSAHAASSSREGTAPPALLTPPPPRRLLNKTPRLLKPPRPPPLFKETPRLQTPTPPKAKGLEDVPTTAGGTFGKAVACAKLAAQRASLGSTPPQQHVMPPVSPPPPLPAASDQPCQNSRYSNQQQQQQQSSLGYQQHVQGPVGHAMSAAAQSERFTARVLVAFDTNVLLEQEGRRLVTDWVQLVEQQGAGMVQLLMPQVRGGRALELEVREEGYHGGEGKDLHLLSLSADEQPKLWPMHGRTSERQIDSMLLAFSSICIRGMSARMHNWDGRGTYVVNSIEEGTERDRNRNPRQDMNSCVSGFIPGAFSVAALQYVHWAAYHC